MSADINAVKSAGAALVTGAVKRAAQSTGAEFDFLMKMAARESGFNPDARAKTSSAAGLFQFIEQTWLSTVKQYGPRHGLGNAAAQITKDANGRLSVADGDAREAILNLRFDAEKASAMAGELANENQKALESKLKRAATSADLYTAHFIGPTGAVKLLSAASNAEAAGLLPKAAAANRNVFYDGARAKTVGEVVASIAKSMGGVASKAANAPGEAAPEQKSFPPAASYRQFVASSFSAPARGAISTHGLGASHGLSAVALGVIDALDATLLREGREESDERQT